MEREARAVEHGATYRRTVERVTSLDPVECATVYAARVVALLYESLLEYDYSARPYRLIPGLALALPEVSTDGLTYTFRLDPEARFHPDRCFGGSGAQRGRTVTAADLVYSLKRLADAKGESSGYWLLDGRVRGIERFHAASRASTPTDYSMEVAGLQATDAHTLRIELTQPSPIFQWLMAMPYTVAVPPEAVQYYGATFGEHPVGSGPYRLTEWRRNYRMRFERMAQWRGWHSGPAAITAGGMQHPFETLLFPIMEDATTQWLAFLSGELDLQSEIARDSWELVVSPHGTLRPELAKRNLILQAMPTLEVAYIGINMEDTLLGSNRKLRQALNAAFDGPRWERYYQGRVMAANGAVPPEVAGHLAGAAPYAFNIELAKRLLAEAGFPEGRDPTTNRRLRLTLDLGRTTQEVRESTELIVSFMERLGIELVPEYQNWPAFLRKVSQRQSQLFRIGWVGDYPDAENFLQLFYGPNASPGPNRCNFSNDRFDSLYRSAAATADGAERMRLYSEMQALVREECPWIFIHFSRAYTLHHERLKNYLPSDFPYGAEKYLRH